MRKYANPAKRFGKRNLLLVLDSNEFVFAFGEEQDIPSKHLLESITDSYPHHTFRICETIVKEVRRHLVPEAFHDFILYVQGFASVDSDFLVPAELFAKYQKTFKPGDAFIAAYAEWVGVQALVTENRRHFHAHKATLPFQVFTAETFLAKHR